ncbi:MAG: fibronectin type III domain-containing protein, partial [Opitutales bacterium]|nr:fibronectin type III domain-containing protein [Opitutales bacterium]
MFILFAAAQALMGLSQPYNFQGQVIGTNAIKLTWDDDNVNVIRFYTPKSSSHDNYATYTPHNTYPPAKSITFTGLATGRTYRFSLCTVTSGGNVWHNGYVHVNLPHPIPDTPQNFSAELVSSDSVQLMWDNVSSENGFQIEWKKTSDASWSIENVGTDVLSHSISNLEPEIDYEFRLKATGAQGDSGYTNILEVYVPDSAKVSYLGGGLFGYETGFESIEGYSHGDLNAQKIWSSLNSVTVDDGGDPGQRVVFESSDSSATEAYGEAFFEASNYSKIWIDFELLWESGVVEYDFGTGSGKSVSLKIDETGSLQFKDGSTWESLGTLATGWKRISLYLNHLEAKYDLFLDGQLQAFGISFDDNQVDELSKIEFTQRYSTNSKSSLDNLGIYNDTPEGLEQDADGDGLDNSLEHTLGTSLLLSDTDGDGISDGFEHINGLDPLTDEGATDATVSSLFTVGASMFVDRTQAGPIVLPGQVTIPSGTGLTESDLNFTWSILSKPSGAQDPVIADLADPSSQITFSHNGLYKLKLTLNGTGYSPSDELMIFVSDQPAEDYNYLIGWWNFNEGSGSTANDLSQWGNDGQITEATYVDGWDGDCLEFVGDDLGDKVVIPNGHDLMNGLDALTFCMRLWADEDYTDDGFITGFPPPGGDVHFNLRYDAEGWKSGGSKVLLAYLNTTEGGFRYESIPNQCTSGEWFHITIVWDTVTGFRFYRNGQPIDAAYLENSVGGLIDGLTTFIIGQSEVSGKSWNGKIDEVRMFARSFTDEEVESLYNDGDADGISDVTERLIIDADPNDAIETFEDVLPGDDFDNDGFSNLEEEELGISPTVFDVKFAAGVATGVVEGEWQLVSLPHTFDDMVVLATPQYNNTENPAVVRVRSATNSSFELKLNSPALEVLNEPFDTGSSLFHFDASTTNSITGGPGFQNNGLSFDANDPAEGTHSLRFDDEWDKYGVIPDHSSIEPGTGDFAISGWAKVENNRWILDKGIHHQTNQGWELVTHKEAEHYDSAQGVTVFGGWKVGDYWGGDWIGFHNVNMGSKGVDLIRIRFGTTFGTGGFEVRLDSPNGQQIAWIPIWNTGSFDPSAVNIGLCSKITGTRSVYIKCNSGPMDIDWVQFCYLGHEDGTGYSLKSYGGLSFELRNGSTIRSVGGADNPGWNFFTVNVDRDGDMQLYLNGTDTHSSTDISDWSSVNFDNSIDLKVGKGSWNHWDYFWKGNLDNLRFHNRLLTTTEIQTLYEEKNPATIQYVNNGANEIDVNYLAIEAGEYNEVTHGFDGEAFNHTSSITSGSFSWTPESIGFVQNYTDPVAFGSVITHNDEDPSSFWVNQMDAQSGTLYGGKQVGSDPDTGRLDESLGVLVLESGVNAFGSVEYATGTGSQTIRAADDSAPFQYNLSGLTKEPEVVILSGSENVNDDGTWPVLYDNAAVDQNWIKLFMDEDRMVDSERSGVAERVSYLAVGQSQDWFNLDTDEDSIPDYWERQIIHASALDDINGFQHVIKTDDYDQDGLRNGLEYILGTNPTSTDTDNDGFSDADEYYAGTMIKDDANHPDALASGDPLSINGWELVSNNLNTDSPVRAYMEDGEYRIASTGTGFGANDQFGWIAQSLNGDFTVTVRVKDFAQLDPEVDRARFGVMVRNSNNQATQSAFASIAVNSDSEYYFNNRKLSNWSHDEVRSYGNEQPFPNSWLKLVKMGERVFAFRSSDSFTWFEAGQTSIEVEDPISLGFFVHSSDNEYYARAAFEILEFRVDSDGDGLSDDIEAQYGTNPNLFDTDGDGISDGEEIALFGIPAEALDSGTVTQVNTLQSVVTGSYQNSLGEWTQDGTSIYTHDINGWVEYGFTLSNAGIYRLSLDVSQLNSTELNLFELGFSIGGVEVERVSKTLATDSETLEVLLPYLDAGTHSLRIQWLRGQPKASLKINTIELQSLEGDDSDSDGIDDWQELRMAVDSDLDETTISTQVSPYCLEGTAGYLPELVISGHKLGDIAAVITPPTAYKSFSNKYYADVSL